MTNWGIFMGLSVVSVLSVEHAKILRANISRSEKEIEIVYDMAQKILQYENVLVEASDVCGELDRYLPARGK